MSVNENDNRERVLPKHRIGSIDFNASTFAQAVEAIKEQITAPDKVGSSIHFANAYNIALAENDESYRTLMNQGDLVFTDGVPVVWAGKRLHPQHKWERVYGPDVTQRLLTDTEINPTAKHFFLGSTPETMKKLLSVVAKDFPNSQVVGHECPPFRQPIEQELDERDRRIRESGATLIWVGLGTPKQDFEARRLAGSLPVTALAVGAAFDFIAGTVEQAPRWVQRSGLEWSYRLAKEPRRLAKRYFWGNPQFIKSVVKNRRY